MPAGANSGRRKCIDCPTSSRRQAPKPGPRCVTHHRIKNQGARTAAHGKRILETYNLTSEQYWFLWRKQGGKCYICQRARGLRKRLAVDHDHACCPTTPTCGMCTRGLLCSTCNAKVLGHLRDDSDALRRAADYVDDPPAQRWLAEFSF